MSQFKCVACGSESFESGAVNAKGLTAVVVTPQTSSRWQRWFIDGLPVRCRVCRSCGFVHIHVDTDKLDELIGEGEPRCRRCRHMLRGISEPRCPECGETI